MAFLFTVGLDQNIITEKSSIATAIAATGTSLEVKNADNFSADDFIIIGRVGDETSEIAQVQSVSSQTLTLTSGVSFAHSADRPVAKILYNQLKLYSASSKTGTYSVVGSAVTIEVDSPLGTTLSDSSGSTTKWYKVTHYNSSTAVETSLSSAEARQGGDEGHYADVDNIRKLAGFLDNANVGDDGIDDLRGRAEGYVNHMLSTVYTLPLSDNSNWDGSPGESVIKSITEDLTTGWLLIREYGARAEGTDKDGYKLLEQAKMMLQDIVDKKAKLLDSEYEEIATASQLSPGFYPTNSQDDTSEERIFSITDKF